MATSKGNSNDKYWEERSIDIENKRYKELGEFEKVLQENYNEQIQGMEKTINDFLSKYASDNKLTIQQAEQTLTKVEMEQYVKEMKKYHDKYKEIKDPEILEKMNLLNARQKMTRMQLLKAQLENEKVAMVMQQTELIEEFLSEQYTKTFEDTSEMIANEMNLDKAFMTAPTSNLAPIIQYPYTGTMFSEAIWNTTDKLVRNLVSTLKTGMVQGKGIDKMVADLRNRMTDKNGKPSTFDLRRIVRTESRFIQERAMEDANKEYGIEKYKIINADTKTRKGKHKDRNKNAMCSVCEKKGGTVHLESERRKGVNSPPFHPHCRCVTAPYVDEKELKQLHEDFVEKVKQLKKGKEQQVGAIPKDIYGKKPVRPNRRDYADGSSDPKYQADKKAYRLEKEKWTEKFDKSVDEYVKKTGEPIFKTREEVKKWADEMDIIVQDELLDFVDLRLFNDVKPVIEQYKKDYPFVFERVFSDGKKYKFELGVEEPNGGLMSAGNGIHFSNTFKDYKNAVESSAYNIATGFNVYGDGTIKTLLHHEMGHNIDFGLKELQFYDEWNEDGSLKIGGAEKRVKWEREYFKKIYEQDDLSEYGHTNELEMFAEGWADLMCNGKPSKFAKELAKALKPLGVEV